MLKMREQGFARPTPALAGITLPYIYLENMALGGNKNHLRFIFGGLIEIR